MWLFFGRKFMRFLMYMLGLVALSGCASASTAAPVVPLRPDIEAFIAEMVERHGFGRAELEGTYGWRNFQPAIIKAISQPATAKPWYEFRPLLVSPQRVDGVAFWNNHAATLERARREFGIRRRSWRQSSGWKQITACRAAGIASWTR